MAPNGLSATFTPSIPLLPDTYYRLYQAGGNYDADGNTLNGLNSYFTTGSGEDTDCADGDLRLAGQQRHGVPLNSQILVRFSSAINSSNTQRHYGYAFGRFGDRRHGNTGQRSRDPHLCAQLSNCRPGHRIHGPGERLHRRGRERRVRLHQHLHHFQLRCEINVSTGFNGAGQLITTNGTADGHWTVVPNRQPTALLRLTPSFSACHGTRAAALRRWVTGDTGFYSGWPVNGPNSDWININPEEHHRQYLRRLLHDLHHLRQRAFEPLPGGRHGYRRQRRARRSTVSPS